MKIKEYIILIVFIIISMVVYGLFPAKDNFQQVAATLVFFLIIPIIFNKIVFKKQLDFFGFSVGDWRQGLIWSIFSLIGTSLILFVFSRYLSFLENYTIPAFITESFVNFLFYQLVITAFFVFIYEFYFRGFVMFLFEDKIGFWSIFLQTAVFWILIFSIGGVSIYSYLPYLVFAPFAGVIAYKSRSILYSGVSQIVVLLILNSIIIKMID